jgi:uridine kinase
MVFTVHGRRDIDKARTQPEATSKTPSITPRFVLCCSSRSADGDRMYRARAFDYRSDTPVSEPPLLAPSDAVLVFDGVFLLRRELQDAWDFSIFVSATFGETLRRAQLRDSPRLGSPEEVERRYRERYIPGQEIYFAEATPIEYADAIIINDDPTNPVLRTT